MRPASEIYTALDIVTDEIERGVHDGAGLHNLTIAREVLAWVAGKHWVDISDGPHAWLVAFLLDDPQKLDDTPPETN